VDDEIMNTATAACRADGDDVLLAVRVRPGARRDGPGAVRTVPAPHGGPDRVVVSWSVRAPASGGRANAALCRSVASAVGVAPSAVSVVSGTSARTKVVRIRDRTPAEVSFALR
jgi:uncharacterized protein YggU (UPF0235/DUF167 family)